MDNFPEIAFAAIVVIMLGLFVYRRLKFGSWTGAFLSGSIERTIGEVEVSRGLAQSQKIRVHSMKGSESDAAFVALVMVSKAALGASMQPYKLSKAQARELATYLNQAAQ